MYWELETPSVIVDLDILDGNITAMASKLHAAGIAHRPHVKTHKSIALARRQLDAGAIGITVAKLGEAEVFAQAGFDNILVAYSLVGERKLDRFAALHERLTVLTTVDSLAVAQGLSAVGTRTAKRVQVLIEIDMGMHRCGIQPRDAVSFADSIRALPGVEIVGVMEYNALVRDEISEPSTRKALEEESRIVASVAEALQAAGHDTRIVSAGSSVAGRYADSLHGITELRCGSYIYYDAGSVAIGIATEAECALRVLATIVSTPMPGRATFDAGSKTLTSDGAHGRTGYGIVVGRPGARVTALNEEHGYLQFDPATDAFTVGDRIQIVPNHACVLPNLTDVVHGVRGSAVTESIRVDARGRNK